jgi:hypothetical protein
MLETEIKNLTAAIELLIQALEKKQPAAEPKSKATKAKAEAPAAVAIPTPKVDALQTRCLDITRIDRANSAKIKKIIASYGVDLLKDIAPESLQEFAAKLEELA